MFRKCENFKKVEKVFDKMIAAASVPSGSAPEHATYRLIPEMKMENVEAARTGETRSELDAPLSQEASSSKLIAPSVRRSSGAIRRSPCSTQNEGVADVRFARDSHCSRHCDMYPFITNAATPCCSTQASV